MSSEPSNIFDVKTYYNPEKAQGIHDFFDIDKERLKEIETLSQEYHKIIGDTVDRRRDVLKQLIQQSFDIYNYQITNICRNTTELSFCSTWFGANIIESIVKANEMGNQLPDAIVEILKKLMGKDDNENKDN